MFLTVCFIFLSLCAFSSAAELDDAQGFVHNLYPLRQGRQIIDIDLDDDDVIHPGFVDIDLDGRSSVVDSAHEKLRNATKQTQMYMSHFFVKGSSCQQSAGMQGICVKRKYCHQEGKVEAGSCGKPGYVCCVSAISCGKETSDGLSYFVNPEYPKGSTQGRLCEAVVYKTHKNICQYRVSFEIFELAGPKCGECNVDTFTVSGYNRNFQIPHLCGCNSNQHIVVPVDQVKCGTRFTVVTSGSKHSRRWKMRIAQIPCGHELEAPSGCLKYFTSVAGSMESFNFKTQNKSEGYFNNLNYAMCIKRANNYCGVTFSSTEFSLGEESTSSCECKKDMIQFPLSKDGLPARQCGRIFNPAPGQKKPAPLKLDTTTPLVVYFRSDEHGPNPKASIWIINKIYAANFFCFSIY